MQFIDEATIEVYAGKGGDGACSFLRLKFMPFGGPDGGNGGDGGSIFLVANHNISTLIDYRYASCYHAQDGEAGSGRQCAGKKGKDITLFVPVGTLIYDDSTQNLIADLNTAGQILCIAKGGRHGIGNACFKSSTNRAPRRIIRGHPGESRNIRLELNLLADVGLIGLPNAGKSSLVRAISSAQPKVADYPFTTIYPSLGVVRVGQFQSFVIADLPGLIQGAAEGTGLGIRFLKHATRTRLLLHVVDIGESDDFDILIKNIRTIANELAQFSTSLSQKKRWLVLNKIDLLPPEERQTRCQIITKALNWQEKYFMTSSLTKEGLTELAQSIMCYLEENKHLK